MCIEGSFKTDVSCSSYQLSTKEREREREREGEIERDRERRELSPGRLKP